MTKERHQDDPDGKPVYLTLIRPRCPSCGCPRFHAYKTIRDGNGDDGITRYSFCLDCGRRVVIVVETQD